MLNDPYIDADMARRIDHELAAIECEHGVRILLAVESGSRAWRFPSLDSDYDVRFLYVRPVEAYLSIETPSDVIERPLEGLLDINGWDVRKALQLLVRSNAVLLEWLCSPVRYRDDKEASESIHALARETCHLPAVVYHYDRLARRSLADMTDSGETVRLKSYCYVLRPVLALLWLREHGSSPPMDMPNLLDGVRIDDGVREAIAELIARKAEADEQGTCRRQAVLDALIDKVLGDPVSRFVLPAPAPVRSRADALFTSILRGSPVVDGAAGAII